MSTRRSIEKKRMSFSFDFVRDNIHSKTDAKKFEAYVQKVPAYIMTNGLGNTLAYLTTQTDTQWRNVQKVICEWLKQVDNPLKGRLDSSGRLTHIIEEMRSDGISDQQYRAITVEVLALFNWLRRFAKAHRLTF